MVFRLRDRDSRCLYAQNAPQDIHWAIIEGNSRVVFDELLGAIRSGVTEHEFIDAKADVAALLERYKRCQAIDPDDVVPVAQDRALWELRLEVETYTLLIRIYVADIDLLPGHIVALRAHEKVIASTGRETKDLQDAEMRLASDRWDEGRDTFWGLT